MHVDHGHPIIESLYIMPVLIIYITFHRVDGCGVTMFNETSGVIFSPGYPENYPSDISCTYTISIGSEPVLLELMFLDLDMEEETDCGFDALVIGAVIICGTKAENITRKLFYE